MAGGSRSKAKGSSYERELSKLLEGVFGGKFIRSANSGAFIGGKNAARKAGLSRSQIGGQKGDLIPPDHMPRLMVEAKAYADFRFHQLLQPGAMSQLDTWIEQTQEAADPDDLVLICFKINRRGAFVFVDHVFAIESELGNHACYAGCHGSGIITDLESFLSANKDRILRRCA